VATRLSEASLSRAIDHVIRFGDTDVFPHLIENVFLHEQKSIVVESLSKLDLDAFSPIQAVETIAPKSRLGFRTVHQLHYLDSLLFTAAVIEIGGELGKLKLPASGFGPFAYRFDPTGAESLFAQEHTYKSWLDR
jgi:hypothetical protein